jgi:hypothetical protein
LYKYKAINEFFWKTLETSEMWFSHYKKLNDEAEYMYELEGVNKASLSRLRRIIAPHVGSPPTLFPYDVNREPDAAQILDYTSSQKTPFTPIEHLFLFALQFDVSCAQHLEKLSADDRWLTKTIEIAHHLLSWTKNMFLVHCFSDDPQNEIMWTDYAQGGAGACIAYIAPKPTANPIVVQKVNYGASIRICLEDLFPPDTSFRKMVTRKSSRCRYQREWRSFIGNQDHNENGYSTVYSLPIKEIIMGSRAAVADIARVEEIAKFRNFDIRYATLKPRGGVNDVRISATKPVR